MFGLTAHSKAVDTLKNYVDNPVFLWKHAAEMTSAGFDSHYPNTLGVVDKRDQPKLMQDFLSGSSSSYIHKTFLWLDRETCSGSD